MTHLCKFVDVDGGVEEIFDYQWGDLGVKEMAERSGGLGSEYFCFCSDVVRI